MNVELPQVPLGGGPSKFEYQPFCQTEGVSSGGRPTTVHTESLQMQEWAWPTPTADTNSPRKKNHITGMNNEWKNIIHPHC